VKAVQEFDAVVGNPPYIRYQTFAGDARAAANTAAADAGVNLSHQASSWAAFTVHSARFLAPGARLALVVPAELLSVGYAAPVRRFLLDSFSSVTIVTFDEQVFDGVDVDAVVVLADGYTLGPADHLSVRHARNAAALSDADAGQRWTPATSSDRWTPALLPSDALAVYAAATAAEDFTVLGSWGDTKLGMVTGNNGFFAISSVRAGELGLSREEFLPVSPPKSAHLRGLELSTDGFDHLAETGKAVWLFRPPADPSPAAVAYIAEAEAGGANQGYKCRTRTPWWQVPTVAPADLFRTYMNADTPRITTNSARVLHLNSVHGIYLRNDLRSLGTRLLPIASLNSVTLLGAEIVGRAYGGGMLKIEPGEAAALPMPSPMLIARVAGGLGAARAEVLGHLTAGRLLDAVTIVDRILFPDEVTDVATLRNARTLLAGRR